jgi:hypothetical protein
MKAGLQDFFGEVHESACLAFCIVKIGEEVLAKKQPGFQYSWGQVIDLILAGIENGSIYYNWSNADDPDNLRVLNGEKFLGSIIGVHYKVSATFITDAEQIKNWHAKDDQYTIQRYVRVKAMNTITHFRRPSWDPLLHSLTEQYGHIDRLTVYTVD